MVQVADIQGFVTLFRFCKPWRRSAVQVPGAIACPCLRLTTDPSRRQIVTIVYSSGADKPIVNGENCLRGSAGAGGTGQDRRSNGWQ